MLGNQCSHGVKWDAQCHECDLVSAREIIRHWAAIVDEARAIVEAEAKTVEEVHA